MRLSKLVLFFVLFSKPVFALPTITSVTEAHGGFISSLTTAALSPNPAVGDLIVVFAGRQTSCAGTPVPTVASDSKGNSYSSLAAGAITNNSAVVYLATVTTTGSAFTVTIGRSSGDYCYWGMIVYDIATGATYNSDAVVLDQTSTPVTNPAVTTSNPAPSGSLGIAGTIPCCGSVILTHDLNGWTAPANGEQSNGCCAQLYTATKTVSGTFTANAWTNSSSFAQFTTFALSFSGGGGGGSTGNALLMVP